MTLNYTQGPAPPMVGRVPAESSGAESGSRWKTEDVFKTLKEICVPLLSNSLLTVESIPRASRLLSQLWSCLKSFHEQEHHLSPATISYIFFPLSHILQRNPMSAIPDVIMEKLMDVLAALFDQWWWSCPVDAWEQVLMLSAAIVGGVDSSGNLDGKKKARDDETKRAAARCLWTVLRRRNEQDVARAPQSYSVTKADDQFAIFKSRGRMPKLIPILGQTLTSLLETAQSPNRELRATSLRIVKVMIIEYLPDKFMPSILPGVASAMVKVALGSQQEKAWANGDVVDLALGVLQEVIVRAIGDDICQSEGALRTISDLEDLGKKFDHGGGSGPAASNPQTPVSRFFTPRTSVWLTASASQLHIALNTLSPLTSHANPVALAALSRFSCTVASNTHRTLPDTQPLLLSFLLSLSTSSLLNVANISRDHLLMLLKPPSSARFSLLQTLIRSARDSLSALPRLLLSHSEAKVAHQARQVLAVCRLAKDIHSVGDGVGRLLGPAGGIEKWGWSLLSVLEMVEPRHFVSTVQPPQALLEGGSESTAVYPFPTVHMKYVTSLSTREELDRMFYALGAAGGSECLFSVEWFVGVAVRDRGARNVAALWCASKLLEGIGGVSLEITEGWPRPASKRVEKGARWIAKVISELWDQEDEGEDMAQNENPTADGGEGDEHLSLEYIKGLDPLVTFFDLTTGNKSYQPLPRLQRALHSVLALQLLSVTSAILQSRFAPLLLYALYPVLRSLVSDNSYLSMTALASLHLITSATAYASPSNLLLANFDYALDAVARRLDRRHLDPEATKILVVLIQLVGKDVVSRAGDVVEACFDRLDEFHGYSALVEGLVEVLAEVIKAIENDGNEVKGDALRGFGEREPVREPEDRMEALLEWYRHRHEQEEDNEDYGAAPRNAWGTDIGKGKEKEAIEEQPHSIDTEQEPPPTPIQVLTQQIVARSIYFITHPSPLIRARILSLLDSACPMLAESNMLPSIHAAWPYIRNRLADPEPFVVSAAASLIASLARHVGEFMATRIWNDIWPRFRTILSTLEVADSRSALARRDRVAVGTESAYSNSHRLYTSLLLTMRAVVKGVELKHDVLWDILVALRRFLHVGVHEDLQLHARAVYSALMEENADVVWLVLSASVGWDIMGSNECDFQSVGFLTANKWDMEQNVRIVLGMS